VFAKDGRALYFSRAAVPHHRNAQNSDFFGHIGIYAFRMQALARFVSLKQSRLEITEKLEQLRLLENNIQIHVVETKYQSMGVDRPEDIEAVSQIILGNKPH
jgi:3-deoxy-manno-octulosonate cytidylyltransferase (CMP-KDO synthetase)